LELDWALNFDVHYGLKEGRRGFHERLCESSVSRISESKLIHVRLEPTRSKRTGEKRKVRSGVTYLRGIHCMGGTIQQNHSNSLHVIGNERALHLHVFITLFHCWNIIWRDIVSHDGVDKLLCDAFGLVDRF
jgi:hypothetical protein